MSPSSCRCWTRSHQGWDKLSPTQERLLGSTLGLQPASPAERPAKLTAGDKWALNLRAVIIGRGDMDLDTCPRLAQAATITLSGARPCT